ncbi:uncharacterized protein LOC5511015 isoform X1 [Nematostella vectensis]|uniref:uncharacterized protein LOC5511015 isoform X1 n=1 Tax=Nematostella vectensis TaxID=45351 RepID=UPI002077962C|nr:uncharacterized protein LOC5511015 isoform X1 [Nematostella vectensis]
MKSPDDTRRTVLERLRNQEKNRDWASLSSYPGHHRHIRRWSAESGQDNQPTHQYARRSQSPQYLTRIKTPPEYNNKRDLRRGREGVVPPVWLREKNAFERNKDKTLNANYLPANGSIPGIVPNVLYSNNQMVPNLAYPYPPGVLPMPVYMGYAPIVPGASFHGGVPMGNFVLPGPGQELYRRRQMTRSQAATSIQRHFRGWRVRKSSWIFQLRWLGKSSNARHFTEGLIEEFLIEDIIPDLLIDVLSHKKTLNPSHPWYRLASHVCTDLINEDLNLIINQLAAGVFYTHVPIQYLPSHDPLREISCDLIEEVVMETSLPIVKSAIGDLVTGHMTEKKRDDWLEELILETIHPMVYQVACVSLDVNKYEITVSDLIDEVLDDLMRPVIKDAWREVCGAQRQTQLHQVRELAEGRLLDDLCLEHLLSLLAGNNLSLYLRDYTEETMDGLVCGQLIHQYLQVYDEKQKTLSNQALREFHLNLHTDLALDVILNELKAHLDEDMEDLLEKQKDADQIDCFSPS